MKVFFKCVLLATLLGVYTISVWAIPKDLIAESEYTLAENKFNARNYNAALEHLTNARALLGKTNSNIQYLLVKSHWELGQYHPAKKELEGYFEVTPQNAADPDRFKEMVGLISRINEKLTDKNAGTLPANQHVPMAAGTSSPEKNQPVTADSALPIQEPSGNAGAIQTEKAPDKKTSVEKRISLADAKQNGIPTPLEFKVVVGKTVKTSHKIKKYNCQGVMNKPLNESSEYFRNGKIIFEHSNGSEYSSEVWLEYPGNPSKEESRSIYKRSLAEKNEFLRKKFPVPVLKPGVGWNVSIRKWGWVPVRYQVSGIKTINGYDCIEVNGKGEHKVNDRWLNKYSERYCYDYNHNEYVYHESRYQLFDVKSEKSLVEDTYQESRLESLTYE